MTAEPTTSRHNPMKVIFNYQNVFFSFFYDDADACVHRSREYAMNYVLSGEMVLDDEHRQIHVGKGECVFIPRDHRVTMYKKASGGEQYCGIYMCFTRSFLREMYGKYARHTDTVEPIEKFVPGVMKLPPSAEIESLFASMTPYFNPEVKLQARLQEGERADTREMADAQAPGSGYHLLKEERRKVVDVYAEVGFKNPSHFSTAFKKRYGIPPTALGAPSCI